MRNLFISLTVLFTVLAPVAAQDTRPLTLAEGLRLGLERNYDIQIVRNREQITENDATRANAGYYPTADLAAGYSGTLNNVNDQYLSTGGKNENRNVYNQSLSAGLDVNWMVFNGFSIRTTYEKLVELHRMGELNTRLQIENFISGFTAEYYNYIRQAIRLKNLAYAVELSSERVRIVEARYNIGALSRLDLQQANVDLNTDKSQFIKQKEVLHTLFTNLNEMIVAESIDTPLVVADSTIEYSASIDRESVWQSAVDHNIYLKIARKEGDISRLDLRQVQSRNYPYLRFNAGYGYNGNWYQSSTYTRQTTAGLNYGLTMGFTLFDGFNQKRRERNARIEIENRELEYQQTEQSIKADLSNAWMAYRNNMDLVTLETDNLATARDNYQIAIERYKLGQLSGIELREAQNSLLEAEERLVQAEFDTKLCEITLLQIAGNVVAYLEPGFK